MNDMQLISLGLTLLAIFGAMYGNRKSLDDMRDVLRSESKADFTALRAEFAELRAETKAGLAELRAETKADIAELRAESKADIADLRTEMRRGFESLETKLLIHELEHHRK
jgi:F0F1-type ATP synthase membrane subunit b/b'